MSDHRSPRARLEQAVAQHQPNWIVVCGKKQQPKYELALLVQCENWRKIIGNNARKELQCTLRVFVIASHHHQISKRSPSLTYWRWRVHNALPGARGTFLVHNNASNRHHRIVLKFYLTALASSGLEAVYLAIALVPSETACLASSPGRTRRTAV